MPMPATRQSAIDAAPFHAGPSVSDYLSRVRRAGLTWPLPETLDDARLTDVLERIVSGRTKWLHTLLLWKTAASSPALNSG
jgi:hypothetical protein